ncbi:MAG: efflux RND transporter periplasmic adaptor subunit [Acidobacteriota bacterium]
MQSSTSDLTASAGARKATRNMRRTLGIFLILGLGGLVAFRLFQQLPGGATGSGGRASGGFAQRVQVASVERASIRELVSVVGSLRAKERVEVAPTVSGRLLRMQVDLGDRVRAGELIAVLEDEEVQQQVQQRQAGLRVSRAQREQRVAELENVRIELERTGGLHESGLVSSQELEQVQTRFNVAKAQLNLATAQVAQAEASLKEQRVYLEHTRVFSPMAGVVGRRYVARGAQVSANTPIVTLLNLESVVLVANVPGRELTKMQVGSPANVVVDAIAGREFPGEVVRISPLLDPQTRTGVVEIHIPNLDRLLKAEMFARAEISLASERSALVIPRSALVYRGEQSGVFLVNSDSARFQAIEVGSSQEDRVEVEGGLESGQAVVTLGANLLKDGDQVQIEQAVTDGEGPER